MSGQAYHAVATAAALPDSYALCSIQGKPALEIWPLQDLGRLWQHLHNGNGRFDYVMGFRDKGTGEKQYKRSRKVPVERALSWALATVQGGKTPEKSLAFVPYSTNAGQMSRWGGFDFDAHGGELERARRFAFDAFRHLLNCESATILETSGSGGWHVWGISPEFKPVAHWIRLLKGIARDIGAPIESGICEIFPPDTISRGYGKGMRAPGAWNPSTNTFSEIFWQNADGLIAGLPPLVSGKFRRIGEVGVSYSETSPIEKEISLFLLPLSALGELIGGADSYRISRTATRREKLKALVGASFHQVSRIVAEHLARAQFAEKNVTTNADEAEHMKNFAELWEWKEKPWLDSLGQAEREKFLALSTDAERGAFRIIRSYARKAAQDGNADFPIVRDNLGRRIGITGKGAGLLRGKFTRLCIIKPTVPYKPNVAAARFRWLLADSSL
jgi:hypothetical protein